MQAALASSTAALLASRTATASAANLCLPLEQSAATRIACTIHDILLYQACESEHRHTEAPVALQRRCFVP